MQILLILSGFIIGSIISFLVTKYIYNGKKLRKKLLLEIEREINETKINRRGLYILHKNGEIDGGTVPIIYTFEVEQILASGGCSKIKILHSYVTPERYHDNYKHHLPGYNNTWVNDKDVQWMDDINTENIREMKLRKLLEE